MAVSISLSITQNSQDVAANKSNVTVAVTAAWTSGSYNLNSPAGTLTIDGVAYAFNASFNTGRTTSGTCTLYTKTVDVAHNTDGTKTLTCAALYHSNVSSGDVTASASKVLTTIPRASTIGATDANIGAASMIAVTRKSTAYTHSIAYKFGSLSGYITSAGGVSASEVKFSATSVAFTVPTTFYAQIPGAKSGTCTLTIKTYSGATQIGSAQTCTFTATAAEGSCKPTVSGTVEDSNELTIALTGDASKLIRYYSTALCTITAAAKNSATISSKTIGGTAVTEDTRSIPNVESGSVVFAAADSRGYSAAVTVTAKLIPYVKLTNNAAGTRTDPTSGNAKLSITGSYYNGSFGAVDNALAVTYRVDGGDGIAVTPALSGDTYGADVELSGLDYTQAHTIEVTVSDKLESVVKTVTIGKGEPVYDWGENDMNIHVPLNVEGPLTAASAGISGALTAGSVSVNGFPVCGIYDTTDRANVLYNALKMFTGKTGGTCIVTTYDSSDPSQYCISLVIYRHSSLISYTTLKNNGLTIYFNNVGTAAISSGTVAAGHTLHYAVTVLAAF